MSQQINVAILGLGGMGETHVKAAQSSPYVKNIIGYEPDSNRAAKRGEELGIKTTNDLEAILDDNEIKMVCIASVNEVHCEQTIAALEAGKAVLCEKPMGLNLEEAEKMVDAAKRTGNFLQIGFELRYSKMFMQVKDWIDEGLIGEPLNSQCRYYCSEFHLKDSWRSLSKGTLICEKLSHYIDLPRWWFNDEALSVYSMSAPNFVKYFNHSDNHQINVKYKNDAVSTLNFIMGIAETDYSDPLLNILDKQSDDGHFLQYHIYGTKGAIETDVFKRRLRRWEFTDTPKQLYSKIVETLTYPEAEDLEWMHNVHGQNLRVLELVAKGMAPETSPEDALETMRLCYATEKSEKLGQIINLNEF